MSVRTVVTPLKVASGSDSHVYRWLTVRFQGRVLFSVESEERELRFFYKQKRRVQSETAQRCFGVSEMSKLDPSDIICVLPMNCQSKNMDAKDIQLDLHALKRLYGLLEKDGNGSSNADLLDEHSRLLLKNLLDAATKKVLKLHSEIISGQVEASATVSPLSKSSIAAQGKDKNVDGLLDITLWCERSFSGPQAQKKRCRVCLRNTVKQLGPTEDDNTIFFDVPQNLNSDEEKEESKVDCLSKEASEAIKKIELCISAFDIGADHLHLFEDKNSSQTRNRNFDMCQIDKRFVTGNSFLSEFSNQRFVDPLHQVPIVTATEEINQPYLFLGQTFKLVPPTKPEFKQSANKFIIDNVELGRNWLRDVQNPSVALDPDRSSYHGLTMVAHGKSPSKRAPQKDEIPTNKQPKIAARTCIQNQESESTSTNSYSNSTNSDSREYSSADKTYPTTSSTSSETGASLTSHGSYTSNTNEDEGYSSTSSESPHREVTSTSSSSSKNEGYSSYDQPMGPTLKKSSYKKQIGMWRSLKDRLAVIFHHYHHHHHHHDYGKVRKKMSKNKSLYKGRVDSLKREHEAYSEKAVEKLSKSLVREKNKQNNDHGLMKGLLKHVRNSKKQSKKRGKESGGQLTKKKNLKKSHWWKLMQLHRGAKLANKNHVKLGLGKKKARLKALPTIK